MSTGRRIDRSQWPDDRPRRTFFELLDGIHREHGSKTMGAVDAEMRLIPRSQVSALLRGTLPVGERHVSDLIRALGGSAEDTERGLALYRMIRLSAAGEMPSGPSAPDPLPSYLQNLTHGDIMATKSAVQEFVEPEVRAHADGTTAGALEILRAEPRLFLFGSPGAGKSTAIRVLVHQMARAYMKSECPDLPVLVAAPCLHPLGDISWGKPGLSGEPWSWLASAAHGLSGRRFGAYRALQTALRTGYAHIFVDGLDEIPDVHQRSRVADALDYMMTCGAVPQPREAK